MKTKYAVPILALLSSLGFTTITLGDSYGNPSGSPSAANAPQGTAPAAQTVAGTVQKVDASNSNIQVKDSSGNVQTIKVDNTTQITRQGTPAQLTDLQTGDIVTVTQTKSTM